MPKASEAIPIGMASSIIPVNANDHCLNLGTILLTATLVSSSYYSFFSGKKINHEDHEGHEESCGNGEFDDLSNDTRD